MVKKAGVLLRCALSQMRVCVCVCVESKCVAFCNSRCFPPFTVNAQETVSAVVSHGCAHEGVRESAPDRRPQFPRALSVPESARLSQHHGGVMLRRSGQQGQPILLADVPEREDEHA